MLKVTGFSEILLAASMLTGLVVLWDWLRRRRKGNAAVEAEGAWLEISKSFFPVILAVFVVRSYLYEPFKIPSGSMIPTLRVGDFILVNKFDYGIRMPVTNRILINVRHPQHGDVMVFKYPEDPSTDYIKRVVGLPGDLVVYDSKRLTINGKPLPTQSDGTFGDVEDVLSYATFSRFKEQLGEHLHSFITLDQQPPVFLSQVRDFPDRQNCVYNAQGFACKVPPGHYFMMGDNRDRSSDSRYWGFVPENNIVGKAVLVWMNFQDLSRIGTMIR
ncbi:MAG: signal peptidase I [Betaproteobacteria bacterium]|nr:signal peptidase I [Betaproteobacteria bacterium]